MACSLGQRCASFECRPWTLKPVQGDEIEGIIASADCRARDRRDSSRPSASSRVRSRRAAGGPRDRPPLRSEEHTSELQSLMRISYSVFCLKKKKLEHHAIEQTEKT